MSYLLFTSSSPIFLINTEAAISLQSENLKLKPFDFRLVVLAC
jgi:hypothetical protein